jgi:hypothetical protein
MSCGEPTQHIPFDNQISEHTYEELQLFLKAVDITPTNVIMKNGMIDKTDKNWYGNKLKQNYRAILKAWIEKDD